MGSATRHRQAFLKANPLCIFCGGIEPATTIEHCPPRALFQFRQWPEGFEFPACGKCNGGTSNDDLLLAMLARMNPFDNSSDTDGRTAGIIMSVLRQFPGIGDRMQVSASEARKHNRRFGLVPRPGQLHQETGVVNVPSEMSRAVSVVGGKLTKAIYFLHTGRPFPTTGCLLLHWFTNVHLMESGNYPILESMAHFEGPIPPLVRTGKYLNQQFAYKITMDAEGAILALQVVFGKAFGFVVFGSVVPGKLEEMHKGFAEEFPDKPALFSVVQSSLLPATWPPAVVVEFAENAVAMTSFTVDSEPPENGCAHGA